jgi:hypothetical protein
MSLRRALSSSRYAPRPGTLRPFALAMLKRSRNRARVSICRTENVWATGGRQRSHKRKNIMFP